MGCSSILSNSLIDRATVSDAQAQRPPSEGGSIVPLRAGEERPWLESWRISDRAMKLSDNHPSADVIIRMESGHASLSKDAEMRLFNIARQMREDGRILLRLEGYIPETGSSALNLGVAERALQQIKSRLVDLRISPRRILMSPLGEQRHIASEFESGWVKLHLIRPSYSARID